MRQLLLPCALVSLAACASHAPDPQPASDCDAQLARIEHLEGQVTWLTNRLGHVESELVALNPEGEFTSMTIDEAVLELPGNSSWSPDEKTILCHVVEWNGFGRLKRFTRNADQQFYLEAPDHPVLHARMAEGGICNSDGSVRYAILAVTSGDLEPGVEYTLRPRNEVEGYKWVVPDSLSVARAE